VYGAMGPDELQKAVEKEFEMALQDRVMEETKEKKNAVEAYVYDMRNKVYLAACFHDVLSTLVQYVIHDVISFLFSFMRSTMTLSRQRTRNH
jgi:hypothetical protein